MGGHPLGIWAGISEHITLKSNVLRSVSQRPCIIIRQQDRARRPQTEDIGASCDHRNGSARS